jgi:hypothetical protein
MDALVNSVLQLLQAVQEVVWSLGSIVGPWLPLIAWLAFWTFAVNWVKLRDILNSGAWVGLLLVGFVTVLVWGSIAPPPQGSYDLFGLTISNFVGKTVYVTGLFCLMLLAGALQLSGFGGDCCRFADEPAPADEQGHGHAEGDGHGQGAAHLAAHH